jgi:hypothetical protein
MPTLEYLTSNESIAYPFMENALGLAYEPADQAHGATAVLPLDFISDLVIITPEGYYSQVFLQSIERDGDNHTFLFVNDQGGAVDELVINVSQTAVHNVIQSSDNLGKGIMLRLLTGPSFASWLASQTDFTTDLFQERLAVETAAMEFRPCNITAVEVPDGLGGFVVVDDALAIFEGYNMSLLVEDEPIDDNPDTTDIQLNAIPGEGLGIYSDCDQQPSIVGFLASLAQAQGDQDGNLEVQGDPCHRIEIDPANNRLILHNDCLPCCDCQDYANMSKTLENLFGDSKGLADQFDALVARMNLHIIDYNENVFPLIRTVRASAYITPGAAIDGNTGAPNFATVGLVLTNKVTHDTTITGTLTFSDPVTIRHSRAHGKQKLPITGAGLVLDFTGLVKAGTELRTYVLVNVPTGAATLTGQIQADWTQYGQPGTITADIDVGT